MSITELHIKVAEGVYSFDTGGWEFDNHTPIDTILYYCLVADVLLENKG